MKRVLLTLLIWICLISVALAAPRDLIHTDSEEFLKLKRCFKLIESPLRESDAAHFLQRVEAIGAFNYSLLDAFVGYVKAYFLERGDLSGIEATTQLSYDQFIDEANGLLATLNVHAEVLGAQSLALEINMMRKLHESPCTAETAPSHEATTPAAAAAAAVAEPIVPRFRASLTGNTTVTPPIETPRSEHLRRRTSSPRILLSAIASSFSARK